MVGVSSKGIVMYVGAIVKGEERSFFANEYRKSFGEEITVGRSEENDISLPAMYNFVGRVHGKITSSSKLFGFSTTVWYEDTSTFGTRYLAPGVTDISKGIKLHKQKVEVKSGCKLLILDHKGGVEISPASGMYLRVLF